MTSVPQATYVRDVFLNRKSGLLEAPRNGYRETLYLEMSIIDVAVLSEVA